MKSGKLKRLRLEEIKPYWRNPRDNKAAVERVRQSMERYGYTQPITVDTAGVIITGHARFHALQALGETEVDVLVLDLDPAAAKEYRIIDNKTSEWAEWNDDLVAELREMPELMELQDFFRENLHKLVLGPEPEPVTEDDVVEQEDALTAKARRAMTDDKLQVACPHCGGRFIVEV